MIIYPAEQEAGLSDLLSAKSSIVYASLAEKSAITEPTKKKLVDNKALAGIDDSDLYYTQSILVTTSWNKNDDIFDAKEVWLAKDTPTHKPTNLEHNENAIVGHITSNWPINEDGQLLEDNLEINSLPEKFHILTGSVIYQGYTEPELKERASTLIEEIESGSKYVSMECFFKGFDYGLINKTTGKYQVLERNADTAFLTRHLRAYGGIGEHQDYKVGRVLRQITFSGKGFVNKPANPESIIFTKDNLGFNKQISSLEKNEEKNDDSNKEGVFSKQVNLKETNMSIASDTVQPETAETTPVVEETTVVTPAEAEVQETSTVVDHQAEAAKKMSEDLKKKEEELKKMKAALETATNELSSANEVIAAYKSKEEDNMKKEKKAKRVASLVENGVSDEMAQEIIEKFESLDDTAFDAMASLLATVKTEQNKSEPTKAEEVETKPEDVSLALETVETSQEIDLSVGSETESEIENTRAALVDFVCIRLGKKLNKGE